MTINLHLPSQADTLKPKITVVGVGGAGGNAVNNMIAANLEGVDFVMANTDAQALETSMTDRTIQLGMSVTRGLGAGANPNVGSAAAEEALEEIADHIGGSNMVFITAGMGGGTGTGAAPVIAQMAREQGILTVGVVTKPFQFEGTHRMRIAESGIDELQEYVDTLIVIPNQNLFRVANEKTTFADAFRMADEVLHSGVRGVTDLMVKPGLVNLDFADIRAVMSEMGKAMMGTGEAEGDKRAIDAAESAISNPLLDDVSLNGANAVLINITGGPDMTLFEVDEAANRIRDEVDNEANIIFGSTFSDAMEGKMRVSVVATGIDHSGSAEQTTSQPARSEVFARLAEQKPEAEKKSFSFTPQKQEFSRERTAAEIVRDSGTSSATELARQATERVKQERKEKEVVKAQPNVEMAPEPEPEMDLAPRDVLVDDEQFSMEGLEVKGDNHRKPFKLGEVKEQFDGPLFMSPRAEQPSQRTHMVSQVDDVEEVYEDEASSGSSFSLFQKIAGAGKAAFASRADEEEDEYVEEEVVTSSGAVAKAAVKKEVAPAAEEDEEYLDIPAFLRRQAN